MYLQVFELIDMRTFSSVWYWVMVAYIWSSTSHWILGVPFDLVTRARRRGGEARVELETLVGINVHRQLYIMEVAGSWVVGMTGFALAGLGVMGFWYALDIAQAVFLVFAPLTLVRALGFRLARRIKRDEIVGEELIFVLSRHRTMVQVIGLLAIVVTVFYGMSKAMRFTPL